MLKLNPIDIIIYVKKLKYISCHILQGLRNGHTVEL